MAIRSKETLFNAALYHTGHRPADKTGIYEAMDANYDEIVRAAFEDASGALPFGKARSTLTSRSAGTFGYEDSYTLPDGVVHVVEVYFNEVSASDIQEAWELDLSVPALLVNANARTIEIEYVREGEEHTWSANFALGVQRALEAVIKNVIEEPEEGAFKSSEAEAFFFKASIKGSKNRSKTSLMKRGGGRLMRARRAPYKRGAR
jgi:hypothetical protein